MSHEVTYRIKKMNSQYRKGFGGFFGGGGNVIIVGEMDTILKHVWNEYFFLFYY
jgi:hypothetical protein